MFGDFDFRVSEIIYLQTQIYKKSHLLLEFYVTDNRQTFLISTLQYKPHAETFTGILLPRRYHIFVEITR